MRKEHLEEKNCQGDLWQENCSDSQIKGTIKNIGEGWKGIGDSGKESNQGKEKWKQLQRKKKLRKKIQELENVLQMVTYLVCNGLKYGFKVLISRVRQATKDVVKSEV